MAESRSLRFLYHTRAGRLVLRPLTSRGVSRAAGWFLDTRLSKPMIKRFVRKNDIDLADFESDNFRCFNDCFCRKIKDGRRPINEDAGVLISPCDGLLSAYRISGDTVLAIKQSRYTLGSLLCDDALAARYRDGVCLVFRLCVNHYHRYCYPADGEKGENIFIRGKLHTVRPIALEASPVFCENCREYTVIDTDDFGLITQIEVGALLVGKIANLHGARRVERGEEKGMFLYGGSTVVLLLERDKLDIDKEFFAATERGEETPVVMGQALGRRKR
ncbi:MAG: phosphatidylserine decarboxylase [Clostridia bacterium]|nr:phosphatidylserine decarboxylase [Clostridia bacterium]